MARSPSKPVLPDHELFGTIHLAQWRRPGLPAELQHWFDLEKNAGYTDEDIRFMKRLAVPDAQGQRRPGKRGRETKWTAEHHFRLLKDVLKLAGGNDSRKISAACRVLAKREPWRSLIDSSSLKRKPAQILRERFVRICMGAIDVYKNIKTGELHMEVRRKQRKRGRS